MSDSQTRCVRTAKGINLGRPVPIGGKLGVHMKQGNKEEDILPESFAEYVTGRKVIKIIYGEELPRPPVQYNNQLPTLS